MLKNIIKNNHKVGGINRVYNKNSQSDSQTENKIKSEASNPKIFGKRISLNRINGLVASSIKNHGGIYGLRLGNKNKR